jgi:hypothetical protein
MNPINQQRKATLMTAALQTTPWDADGVTILYAAPHEEDAVSMIEIRANVTEAGWDTVAFIEAIWPNAKANARLIAAAPDMLAALEMQQMAEYDPEASRRKGYFDRARELRDAAIAKATQK